MQTATSARTVLVILDIDGTLCDSTASHERAFAEALSRNGMPVDVINPNDLLHYTDSWIFGHIFSNTFGRSATLAELVSFEKDFTGIFKNDLRQKILPEIAGARDFLRRLIADQRTAICFVTGSFAGAARVKLKSLDIDSRSFVVITASDFQSREDAVRNAIEKVAVSHAGGFKRLVSIGDGWWDFKTARNLGLEFIAVNMVADSREKLPAEVKTFENFSNADEILWLIRS